jgi:hypothetical protein
VKLRLVCLPVVASAVVALNGGVSSAAHKVPMTCAPKDPYYSFSSVVVSTRPTNLHSAYITGPGTIVYDNTATATVGASMTGTVSTEAGVVFAKASTSLGVGVTASRTWTDGFTYSLDVPKGQKRRMRLTQESRTFLVTKKAFDEGTCRYTVVYADNKVNAPRKVRNDSWVLES